MTPFEDIPLLIPRTPPAHTCEHGGRPRSRQERVENRRDFRNLFEVVIEHRSRMTDAFDSVRLATTRIRYAERGGDRGRYENEIPPCPAVGTFVRHRPGAVRAQPVNLRRRRLPKRQYDFLKIRHGGSANAFRQALNSGFLACRPYRMIQRLEVSGKRFRSQALMKVLRIFPGFRNTLRNPERHEREGGSIFGIRHAVFLNGTYAPLIGMDQIRSPRENDFRKNGFLLEEPELRRRFPAFYEKDRR